MMASMAMTRRLPFRFLALACSAIAFAPLPASPPSEPPRAGATDAADREGEASVHPFASTARVCMALGSPAAAVPHLAAVIGLDMRDEDAAQAAGVALIDSCFHARYTALRSSLSPRDFARLARALSEPSMFTEWLDEPSSRRAVAVVSEEVVAAERDFAVALDAIAGEERRGERDRLDIDRMIRAVPRSGTWRSPASVIADRRPVDYASPSALLEGAGSGWAALLADASAVRAASRQQGGTRVARPSIPLCARCAECLEQWSRETAAHARAWFRQGLRDREATIDAARSQMCTRSLRLLASLHQAADGSNYSEEVDRWLLFCVERELGELGGVARFRRELARARALNAAKMDRDLEGELRALEAGVAKAAFEFARHWSPGNQRHDEDAARAGWVTSNRRLLCIMESQADISITRLRNSPRIRPRAHLWNARRIAAGQQASNARKGRRT